MYIPVLNLVASSHKKQNGEHLRNQCLSKTATAFVLRMFLQDFVIFRKNVVSQSILVNIIIIYNEYNSLMIFIINITISS